MGNYGDVYKCKRGQIFWLREEDGVDKFSPTITIGGDEIPDHRVRGTRPVVVISNDKINWSSSKVIVCPIRTPKERLTQRRFRSQVLFDMNGRQRIIVVDDMKAVNVDQLDHFIGTLGDFTMRTLNDSIAFVTGLLSDEENVTDSTNDEASPSDNSDASYDEVKEEEVSPSPVEEVKEKPKVAPPKKKATSKEKVRSANEKWTEDLAVQFLIDCEELGTEEIMSKYSIGTLKTLYSTKWKFKKTYEL